MKSAIRYVLVAAHVDSKETVLELNGCTIEAYPSNHIDAYRALDNPKFILIGTESEMWKRAPIRKST